MSAGTEGWVLVALVVYVGLIATYFVARFGGFWAETDSAAQALAIRSVLDHASLVPDSAEVYPNGSAYASVSIALLAFTGLDVASLQQLVFPLTTVLLVLPAWALYRELTGNLRGAVLATLLLFTNPEFLFVVLRGSHERMLRALMLVALWLLVRSFRYRTRPAVFAVHVLVFYAVCFGLVSTNVFFGLSFVFACATALAGALVLKRFGQGFRIPAAVAARRFMIVSGTQIAVVFLFIFYLYPPAIADLRGLATLGERLLGLGLGSAETADAYRQVAAGWTSLYAYFLLSIQDYLLMLASASIWLWLGISWLRGGLGPPSLAPWLLWLLYGAFMLQGGLAIIADRSGYLGGNLQHRLFPSFAMVAAPLIAYGWCQLKPRPLVLPAVAILVGLLTGPALLKATNEPTFSNKWMFYTSAEVRALVWANERHRHAEIWVGPDERLSTAYDVAVGQTQHGNRWDIYEPEDTTRSYLLSEVVTVQSVRLGSSLPPVTGENRVYDSGSVQLYRLRPQTPYQP